MFAEVTFSLENHVAKTLKFELSIETVTSTHFRIPHVSRNTVMLFLLKMKCFEFA